MSSGTWAKPPPAVILAGTTGEFGALGPTLKGTKGRCTYTVDGADSPFIFQVRNCLDLF